MPGVHIRRRQSPAGIRKFRQRPVWVRRIP
jgi:hypothetical protein